MTAGLAIAGASLAIWIYLIAARGGFWRAAERDDDAQPGFTSPRGGSRSGEVGMGALRPFRVRGLPLIMQS